MAEITNLEQRFESISVQDENLDINTAIAAQHKQKVTPLSTSNISKMNLTL
jgi:hypothetical protein